MMGHQATGREQLFYTFSMEDHVPDNHLLRGINRFLDLSDLWRHLEPFYSVIGRPSIDPELMVRMLVVGYPLDLVAVLGVTDSVAVRPDLSRLDRVCGPGTRTRPQPQNVIAIFLIFLGCDLVTPLDAN